MANLNQVEAISVSTVHYRRCAKGEDGAEVCSSGLSRKSWEEDVVRSPFTLLEPTEEEYREIDEGEEEQSEDATLVREEAEYKAQAFRKVAQAAQEADWAAEQEAAWARSTAEL